MLACEKDKIAKRALVNVVIMGRDSYSRGHGFESQHQKLVEELFALIFGVNCIVCVKRPERGWDGLILKQRADFRTFLSLRSIYGSADLLSGTLKSSLQTC